MIQYIGRKAAELFVVMLIISFFSFGIIYIAPGDISNMYIKEWMTDEEIAIVRAELGVDEPFLKQYGNWLKHALQGDFGKSAANDQPVMPQLTRRLPSTVLLMGTSSLFAFLVAIPLGLWSGRRPNSALDRFVSGLSYAGISLPSFWFAMILIIIFSGKLGILPSSGMHTVGRTDFWDGLKHMILPVLTLSIGSISSYTRYIRANTMKEMNEEYVVTARAKGLRENGILKKHVLKNTLLPIITILGMSLPSLFTGSFITETIFAWPGIGSFAREAIGKRDFPIIMAYVMISGSLLVIGNFIADVLYAALDPRIRKE